MDQERARVRGLVARHNARRKEPVTAEVDEATLAAAREMRTGKLRAHIKAVVDGWPPLTDDQRDELALLLRPAGTGRRASA